ncbi:pectate lyase [Streptomyces sp. CRN 30]|uniref:pectate lyase family protein n=1 Tax=Streptomyces sp. CRN 30 TaxID=3075613 RepID=UPI002A833EFF|nr:pectate lyase [Streptomyces sp. CRN 30]
MRTRTWHAPAMTRTTALVGCTALVLAVTATTASAHGPSRDLARQTLAAKDGWAAEGAGTTGGAAATVEHVYTVTTWAQFKAALAAGGNASKIVRIKGTIDPVAEGCDAFEAEGYDFDAYLEKYSPENWGLDEDLSAEPADSPEGLRAASAAAQDKAIKVNVPSNTTIVGVGRDAGIRGGSLQIRDADNVIVRNLTIEAPLDCFPQWDPTDGDSGAWNSEYDAVVVYGSTHVWIDHNTLTDGRYPDSTLPTHFGQTYQQHDGLLDIVRGANYVTASWNSFENHDKTILIGNSDSASATDAGKLKVTLHHNRFKGIVERAPRVRFGQVDTYNNHYVVTKGQKYGYSLGVGISSQLYAEKNAFSLPAGTSPAATLKKWSEAPLTAEDNLVNGKRTDLIAVHNAEKPAEALQSGAGWKPVLRTKVDNPLLVPLVVGLGAGAGKVR